MPLTLDFLSPMACLAGQVPPAHLLFDHGSVGSSPSPLAAQKGNERISMATPVELSNLYLAHSLS